MLANPETGVMNAAGVSTRSIAEMETTVTGTTGVLTVEV